MVDLYASRNVNSSLTSTAAISFANSGAVLGELAAGWFNPDGLRSHQETVAFAQMIAGLGGALVAVHTGGGAQSVAIAATAGGNAAQHNFLTEANHRMKLRAELLACTDDACRNGLQVQIDQLTQGMLHLD